MDENDYILKVKASSVPHSVASAIAHGIYDGKSVVARCIGAGAVNQAVKATAIARGWVAERGRNLVVVPGFQDLETDKGTVSAIVLLMQVI